MEIFLPFLIIIAAIFVLIQAGKKVVQSLGILARFLHVSEYILSFVFLAFATSLPELSTGINSALLGIPQFSFGDIIGTNIVNFTLILGVIAVAGGTIKLKDYSHFKNNRWFEMMVVLAPLFLILDGVLSRLDGVILLIFFVWNIFRLLDIDDMILGRKVLRPHLSSYVHSSVVTWKEFYKHLLIFILSISSLLISTVAIVITVKELSPLIGMSHALIGILIISVVTSLPDLVVGLRGVKKNLGGIALGDIFGAAAINATLTLGIVSLISPIILNEQELVWIGIIFTVLAFGLTFIFLKSKNSISRREGFILIGIYLLFVLIQSLLHFF